MESQIENAIEIAWNPTSDQALKSQAFDYLNQLRADPQAWQVCVGLFTRTPRPSEVVRLVSLEIVNNAILVQSLDTGSLLGLRDALLGYVRSTYGTSQPSQTDSSSLQNKLTQTLTLLFVSLYKQGWETFIDDFLALTILPGSGQRDNVAGVILYLRILGSIHDEIADVLLVRQDNQARGHTELKDLLRARDVGKVAQSWQDLLAQYGNQNDGIVEMTLKVIGKWAGWIDISLIINDGMLSLILPLVGRSNESGGEDKVRDAAVEAFTEIVGKKMRPADKTEMISFLNLQNIISQLIASPPLNEFKGTPQYDTDLAEAVAKLVNTVMADIVRVLEDRSTDDTTRAKSNQLLHDFIPLLLRFFSDEYDEICSTVIPSLTDVLAYFRKLSELPASFSETLPPILNAIIMKMRYDETSSWGSEDEQTDEAEFQELRKRLQVLQKTVAVVDQNLYVDVLSNLVANTFQTLDEQGSQMDWRDVDLALHEMFLFGELAMPNQGLGAKNQASPVASERLVAMMTKMVQSGIANFPHPAILLHYMEICVRYCAFFESQSALIGQVLENFVRLVHHEHVRIRTRSWYLFHRFVKHLRAQVGNVAETVIQSIGDLLPIHAEVPGEDADDDMSSDQTDNSADAVFASQLYLFEAIGCISSTASTPIEKQALYARSVMDPLFADMEQHLPRARAGDAQAILQIHHIIMALGTLAHGFSDWTPGANSANQRPPPAKALSDEFARAAEAILIALSELNSSSEIRTACRSAFSRLLGVLGSAVLPQLPQWIDGLLSRSSSKDEMAMFLRLLDQVVYGFKTEIYDVLNQLLTPLLQRVFGGLSEPINGTDDEIQLAELRREYLTFVVVIINNDLAGVLVSEANQGFFESLINSILALATDIGPSSGNLPASRLSFGLLAKMAGVWGGPDVANISATPSAPSGSPSPVIPGFDQFLIDRFHSVCWDVLRDPQFNPSSDAQARQVLHEIAGLEQAIYLKTGEKFLQHLQSTLFPGLGTDGNEFLRAMTTATAKKSFSEYLQGLLSNSR
ncbi:Xpo1-domain-containing protein [Annulohypoxylon truncatum]|uniref:Xpo1-domain-containing protein n=1 Tax=Annulohypoxylon truncatum TaxID=327061 RepID=UPI0020084A74|nr:Xpo1-domain-containing protein [Annulohypoxylon truncatum]KAI1206551.1 Xpo1-domain-containing protein [Annulohypoxylon truncatum]